MAYLEIAGGKKLHGSLVNQSAKNSAVSILCACLMVKAPVTLSDVPGIEEVYRILELLTSIGVRVERLAPRQILLDASGELNLDAIDRNACESMRSSLLLFGALAARAHSYKIYKTGGCKLGNRTIKPHVFALEKLGVKISSEDKYYQVYNEKLHGNYVVMYESGDTATENVIMAAVLAEGETIIKLASANYMVQDLCHFLNKAGAKIKGIGGTTLIITGVKELKNFKEYAIMPDPIVAMTYLAAAIVTGSNLTIKNCPLEFLELELLKLEIMGQKFFLHHRRLSSNGKFVIVDIEIMPSKLMALPDKIEARPFPGLNIDNLPAFVPILAKSVGRTLIHDWAYENRAIYNLDLQKLGVHVTLLDPHRTWVEGPTKFHAADLNAPPALRPAVNVLLCMLAAPGKSILRDTYIIERGYENLYEVLNSVGADIKIIKE